jgi:hypothetical protein
MRKLIVHQDWLPALRGAVFVMLVAMVAGSIGCGSRHKASPTARDASSSEPSPSTSSPDNPACTAQASRLVEAVPGLETPGCSNETGSAEEAQPTELQKKALRKRSLLAYEKDLAVWGEQAWSVPASSLAACDANVQGSGSLRLVIMRDPCLPLAPLADPYDAFLLVRNPDQKVIVSELVDGGYRGDATPEMKQLNDANGQPLILVGETGVRAYRAYESLEAFRLNPKTSRPEPAEIFPVREVSPGTSSKNIVVSQATDGLSPQWIEKGKLADQFDILKEDPRASGEEYNRVTYRWNGKGYAVVTVKHEPSLQAKAIASYRACLKANFGTAKVCDEPDDVNIACEKQNDLAWLNFKANKLQDAMTNAQQALASCKEKPLELKHADYNYQQIQKALQAGKH